MNPHRHPPFSPRKVSRLAALLLSFAALHAAPGAAYRFAWQQLAPIPFEPGLKGFYALSSGNTHWLMGGSAFPVPAALGGTKAYFDTIYRLTLNSAGEANWETMEQTLPEPLAEGASLPVADGALLIGGHNSGGIRPNVTRVSWCPGTKRLRFTDLPPLPIPLFHPAAAILGNELFIAGGHDGAAGTRHFWSLDMEDPASGWRSLPTWPGPPRFGATLEVLRHEGRDCLYLFSGKSASTQPRSQANYLRDVYRFDPATGAWSRMADIPHAALIGVPAKLDSQTLALFSGSDGHDIERLDEIGTAYRLPKHVQLYSADHDTWSFANEMPVGLIGVPTLATENGFILAGGEYSPSLRSAEAYLVTPIPLPENASR